ncbi:DUF1269 domain-containing protein [Microbacterium mangrovi]|uniref:DUF1269 domain-containing protein n=1 Tax=Microbacterium mangrovi TaxID=1348253 RepID=UPI00057D51DB|nr:DUF1269 domain-containing protein [Microbacterium mangrovi]
MTDATQSTAVDADETVSVAAAAVTDGAYTLIAAEFGDTDTALQAYEALKEVENGTSVEIDGVLVVKRDEDGTIKVQKVTDHSTRRGLGWGALGGVVLGVLFPPTIIGSALVLGAGGAGVGALRERHHKKELAEELQDAIAPGHSGIIALVSDPGEIKIRKALEKADRIVEKAVDEAVADDLKTAAKAAEADDKAAKADAAEAADKA